LIITEKPNLFYECFLCGRKFQFGQYVYERPIHSGLAGQHLRYPRSDYSRRDGYMSRLRD